MTEDELDQVHEIREKISERVHMLVDEMTRGLPADIDDLVRLQLNEDFRFWRRDV